MEGLMKNYFITTTIILLFLSSGVFAIDISINGKFYADLRTDFYEGSGIEGGSEPSMDGDPKYKWDASLDLIFKAIFNEDMHAYVNLRADKFLINNNYRTGLSDIRWRDKYIFERDARGTGTGIALNECYLKWQGIPGFTTEHFGLMEWRLGEGGIYNYYVLIK
jgi:hypothetical protein